MARDRVYNPKKIPTYQNLKELSEEFLSGIGKVKIEYGRIYITLGGHISYMFRPNKDVSHDKRWIEIIIDPTYGIDVITREMDEFTNCIADELYNIITRKYQKKQYPKNSGKIVKVLLHGKEVFGNIDHCINWFKTPSIALGGIAPETLLIKNPDLVDDELGRIKEFVL